MQRLVLVIALAVGAPAAALAQQPAAGPATASDPAAAAIAGLRDNWQQVASYLTRAADQLSEADYSYRPVETVRTFGQIIGHVAGSQFMMCAAALGDSVPAEDAVEKAATTKEALVKALRESTDYCARAYAQTGAAAAAPTELFGQRVPRAQVLALNAVHDGEHYGNIVTYMRMKGMVPPSSQP
jgi:uncharacterized damage-inducible protein DinB